MKRIITIILSLIVISPSFNYVDAQINKSKEQQELERRKKREKEQAKYLQDQADKLKARQRAEEEMERAKQRALKEKQEREQRERERKALEQRTYYNILDSKNLDQYNSFISDYPNGEYTPEIRRRADEIKLWRETAVKESIDGYEHYLSTSEFHWYDNQARQAILDLKKKAERAEWQKVVAKNTLEAYEQYLKQYPNTAYKDEVESAISKMKAQRDWETVSANPTIEGLETYVAKYPNAENVAAAKEQLNIMKAEKYYAAGNINAAYTEFLKVNTNSLSYDQKKMYDSVVEDYRFARLSDSSSEEVLQNFQKQYPNGRHHDQVSNMIALSKASNLGTSSTQLDYTQALSYATDDATRAIVNRHINRSKDAIKEYKKAEKKRIRKANGGIVNIGFEFVDFNVGVSSYDRLAYNYNIGLMLRVGNFNDRVQFAIGVKPGLIVHSLDDEYDYDYDYEYEYGYDYYSRSEDSESNNSNAQFHLPIVAQLKLNLFKSSENSRCFVFGQYQYNAIRPKYIEGQMGWSAGFGFAWPHFDLSFKYGQDIDSSEFCNRIKHFGGVSMIYYWHL
ncbi:MAG: hypothetical protein K2K82_03035 [Muribaculaceae bacterium]|nr:hypothetical protein [Muribaculaceae bacterium]